MNRWTITSRAGWQKTLRADTMTDALTDTYGPDRVAGFRWVEHNGAATIYDGRRTVATVIKESVPA